MIFQPRLMISPICSPIPATTFMGGSGTDHFFGGAGNDITGSASIGGGGDHIDESILLGGPATTHPDPDPH